MDIAAGSLALQAVRQAYDLWKGIPNGIPRPVGWGQGGTQADAVGFYEQRTLH